MDRRLLATRYRAMAEPSHPQANHAFCNACNLQPAGELVNNTCQARDYVAFSVCSSQPGIGGAVVIAGRILAACRNALSPTAATAVVVGYLPRRCKRQADRQRRGDQRR